MYIAWPSIPSPVYWTPVLEETEGGSSPVPYPQPGQLTTVKVLGKRAREAQAGVWAIARYHVTDQNTRERIQLEEGSVCAGFPGEASRRWREFSAGPGHSSGEQGGLSRIEDQGDTG